MTEIWFLALDGDDIGRRLELHMVMEDADGLRAFASDFARVLDQLLHYIDVNPLIDMLLHGGDSLLLTMPESEIQNVSNFLHTSVEGTGFTFSGGYNNTMRGAYLALKLAKATGKNKIVSLESAADL
ncbi:mCpol domain-containing protein [Phytohabitans suffuscus]|uniref:Minimal CRISPR polymerase domain-containing protein n=1 Tax=Phytohabitans suffuscus TaxID=624315 RepID=A0A6F8YIE3_9ACTN|nr:mCpol domain-containing protein [Phytohabitans suffuscus]BCB85856.1 hypothetical protein Psuf_031690 [Phytohabitans suffuscus]